MPHFGELRFEYEGHLITGIPVLLVLKAFPKSCAEEADRLVEPLITRVDKCSNSELDRLRPQLTRCVDWNNIKDYVDTPDYLLDEMGEAWSSESGNADRIHVRLIQREEPHVIYRYLSNDIDKLTGLLSAGVLRMSNPAEFNAPFDCNYSGAVSEAMERASIGVCCFSRIWNSVLMFSHYASEHRGICVGFRVEGLTETLRMLKGNGGGAVRPVWYMKKTPPWNTQDEPALCATTKDAIWSYEDEYRFIITNGVGQARLDTSTIESITFGCKADECLVEGVRQITKGLPNKQYFKACREDGGYGITRKPLGKCNG